MPYVGGVAYQPVVIEIGDIEIGAVEIKDQAGTRRASVVNSGGQDRLAVDAWIAGVAAINFNIQVPIEETVIPLGPLGAFVGALHDCINYAGFGVSAEIVRGAGDATVNLVVEDSSDNGLTWHEVETLALDVTAAAPSMTLSRVYSPVRRYMRVSLVNTAAVALAGTSLAVMLKPIP
jgi:hypothetical protein